MKKIIALAVASAFVAPAMAAEVTISGDATYYLEDSSTTTTTTKQIVDGSNFAVKATEELDNGITVSTDFNIDSDGDDGSNSLTVSGPFGKIDIGDASGAIDAIDDKGEWGEAVDNDTDSDDANILYTLPSLAPGLTINVSFSPENGGTQAASGATADVSGISATYSVAGARIGLGTEDVGEDTRTLTNINYGANGFFVSYALNALDVASGTSEDTDQTIVSGTYTMGDVTFAVSSNEIKTDSVVTSDLTAYGVHYNVGGGLKAFVESQSDDKATTKDEATFAGLVFKF